MRFYCDVHRKKDESGFRITYTTDGKSFKHIDDPAEIPAGPGDRVYVDTIPVMLTDSFIQLLRKGVEVYYLRRLRLVKQMRERMGLPKSTKSDIKAMMTIECKWYRRVDENFLEMRRLISTYRSIERTKQQLENQLKAASPVAQESLRRLVRQAQMEKGMLAEVIVEEARRRYPYFDYIAEELGISGEGHLMAREALAELLTYVDFRKPFAKVRAYLGLFRKSRKSKKNKKFSHVARKALNRLTMALINDKPTQRDEEATAFRIWLMFRFRQETHERSEGIPAPQRQG